MKLSIIASVSAAALLVAGAAAAQTNTSTINQSGNNNRAQIDQIDTPNNTPLSGIARLPTMPTRRSSRVAITMVPTCCSLQTM